jgi:Mrp family chromosome partitioning ATPase
MAHLAPIFGGVPPEPTEPSPTPYALDHALAYAAMGMPVLALMPGSKAPAGGHGFKDATTDPEVIRGRFAATPGAGVGIHPGPGRLLVLDIDDKRGKDGLGSLARLEAQHGELPATLRQKTPSGRGFHLFFGLPEGLEVGNASPWSGIDVRSMGGYVAAEPTKLDGVAGSYAFDDWDVTSGEMPDIADAPAWLLEQLATPARVARPVSTGEVAVEVAVEVVSAEQARDLRSAMNVLDADDREVWIRQGMALKTLGSVGQAIWFEWSQMSAKFDPRDAADKWASFKPTKTGYAAAFKAAQALGWVNPGSKVPGAVVAPLRGLPGDAVMATGIEAAAFREVDLSRLDDVAPQVWWWGGYMPANEVTLFSAHGGTGKSTLALMLAACIALGLPFLGKPTKRGRVLYFSGEDPADVVKRRLEHIVREMGLDINALRENLRVIDATEVDPALFIESSSKRNTGETTTLYAELAGYIGETGIDVLIVDNASDVYAANEIDRTMVRRFVRSLAQLVRSRGGAVLLLAHVDKGTSRGTQPVNDESYSGSTAWHNSTRSRLFMRATGDGQLELQHQKSNLGRKHPPLALTWEVGGLPRLADDSGTGGELPGRSKNEANTLALLALIHEFEGRGEWVGVGHTSRSNAAALFESERTYPTGLKAKQAEALLREAQRTDMVEHHHYKSPGRKDLTRWTVTDRGCFLASLKPHAPTAPTTALSLVDGADSASSGGTVPTAPTAHRGYGGKARAQKMAQKGGEAGELAE